jgi:hypothetical protein
MRLALAIVSALTMLPMAAASLPAQEPKPPARPESGLEPGQFLPGSFQSYMLSGDRAGKFHCFVCRQAFYPSVLILMREPEAREPFSEPFVELMKQLDVLARRYAEVHFAVGVIFLTRAMDVHRDALARKVVDELVTKAECKHIQFGLYPLEKEGETAPPGYELPADSQAVVLVYSRLKVRASFPFTADRPLTEKDIPPILAQTQAILPVLNR